MGISPNRTLAYQNPLLLKLGESFFKSIPMQPGVYFFLGSDGKPLYIGKADHLRKRLSSYKNAKPGRVADSVLEMIEVAEKIEWELHESGKAALQREAELLRAIRPPFNRAGTDPFHYLYLGTRYPKGQGQNQIQGRSHRKPSQNGIIPIDFRLVHRLIGRENYHFYGCFKHRSKVKSGYTALLRLIYAGVCEKERFHFPARICQMSPPYLYQAKIPSEWSKPLDDFLKGINPKLLELISFHLLSKENIPRFMIPSIQEDLQIALEFFKKGPKETRRVAINLKTPTPLVTQRKMNRFLSRPSPF